MNTDLGIGDLIAIVTFLWKLFNVPIKFCQALSEFRNVLLHVHSYIRTLRAEERLEPSDLSRGFTNSLEVLRDSHNCTVVEVGAHFEHCTANSDPTHEEKSSGPHGFKYHWQWIRRYFVDRKEILNQKDMTEGVILMQVKHERQLDRLESQIARISESFNRVMNGPWHQTYIEFIDVLGQIHRVSPEVCKTVEGIVSYLMFVFQGCQQTDLKGKIERGEFWFHYDKLLSHIQIRSFPAILADNWEENAKPGRLFLMEVFDHPKQTEKDLKLLHESWKKHVKGSLCEIRKITRW